MVPEDFPLLLAASRQSARFDDSVRILAGGLQTGSIRNKALSDVKDTLSRVVEVGWMRYVSEPFFYGGRYEAQSQPVNDLNSSILMMGLHNVIATHRKLERTKAQGEAVEAMRAFIAEAMPLAEAVNALKKNVVMGRATSAEPVKPVNPNKMVKTCACCFRGIAVSGFTMAHHGYQRPFTGWQTASCSGIRFPPLEVSSAGLEWLIGALRLQLQNFESDYAARDTKETLTVRDVGTQFIEITKESPRWPREFRIYVNELQSRIHYLNVDLPELDQRLRDWRPELGPTEIAQGDSRIEANNAMQAPELEGPAL